MLINVLKKSLLLGLDSTDEFESTFILGSVVLCGDGTFFLLQFPFNGNAQRGHVGVGHVTN